jgi:hypothetical protein
MKVGLDGSMSAFDPDQAPSAETELPASFSSQACQNLKDQLTDFYNDNRSKRLIIVPRTANDALVALTAWNYILKLDTWDAAQAQAFSNARHNLGPERTVE